LPYIIDLMANEGTDALKVPIWIFKTPLSKTPRLIFETTFKNLDHKTEETFKQLSIFREELRGTLEIESVQAIINSIERYMPGFFGLMQAGEALPAEFSKFLKISWTTPIGLRYVSTPFMTNSFRWEVVMCMLTYGIAHRNMAHEMWKSVNFQASDFDDKSKSIAALLTKAAGVFDHIYQQQLSNWKVRPDAPLPELNDELYLALSSICIAEAQEITIKKGLLKGTSAGAISKLCIDVHQKYEHASNLLKAMKGTEDVLPQLFNYINVNIKVWKAFSFKLVAQDLYAKGEYGAALANIKAAAAAATEEKKDPMLEQFLSGYNSERASIQDLLKKYTVENDTIYYDKVPNEVALPEGKCLMKTTPFVPPQPFYIQITQKKGQECCIQ